MSHGEGCIYVALVQAGTARKGGRRCWGAGGGGTELSEATRLLSVLDRPRAPPLKWLTLPCAGWFRAVKPGHGPSGWHFC